MVDRTRELERALGSADKAISPTRTRWYSGACLRAARDIKAGEKITRESIDVLRPATTGAIKPDQISLVIGTTALHDFLSGIRRNPGLIGSKQKPIMKVLYFTRTQSPHDLRFTQALAGTGHQVIVLCLDPNPERTWPKGIEEVKWRGIDTRHGWMINACPAWRLKRVINEIKPDIVHAGPIKVRLI